MPFPAAFPPKRREFLVTAGYPASEIKLWNPMIVGLACLVDEPSDFLARFVTIPTNL